ncbi:hypothetical protein [Massilia scottii]|uniref:hypothetical protein n=1 Tax=Massilia scottii TaxID=3057166 RepID=UPI0027964F20|nr:hypothetical protein [Massilia sp. CCM 9029]MDQ1835231.1 hypothetical protein [Massilia sp. CCM 9029]
MSSARYFLDVDALCKLAHWNILPILPDLLGCQWPDISTVASMRYRAAASVIKPDAKLFHTQSAASTALRCIERMIPAGVPEPELMATLSDIPQIDPGEAVLMSVTASHPQGIFITGDKRALEALSRHPARARLAGKIMCIEQMVKRCLDVKGREWLLANICPNRARDKAVSMVLGSGCDAPVESLMEGLDSYINQILTMSAPTLLAEV